MTSSGIEPATFRLVAQRLKPTKTIIYNYEAHSAAFIIFLLPPPFPSKYSLQHLFSHTFNIFYSIRVKTQVFHPHETEDKIPNWILPKYNAEMIKMSEARWAAWHILLPRSFSL
jgi:hypothetical protein